MQHSTKWIRLPLGGVVGLLVALCGTLSIAQEESATSGGARQRRLRQPSRSTA